MKHSISEYADTVTLSSLGFGPKAETFAHLTIANGDGKTRFDFRFGTDLIVTVRVSSVGVMRFERSRRGAPMEYLQRDLTTNDVLWHSAKPYSASGRAFVEVNLGLEVALG